jgi:hypothetical protein
VGIICSPADARRRRWIRHGRMGRPTLGIQRQGGDVRSFIQRVSTVATGSVASAVTGRNGRIQHSCEIYRPRRTGNHSTRATTQLVDRVIPKSSCSRARRRKTRTFLSG